MGLHFGLQEEGTIFKRKFRWLFSIRGVSLIDEGSVKALPHRRSARPSLSWKEYEVQHLTESVFYPFKPVWEPVELILYDICRGGINCHPVFKWISAAQVNSGMYDPKEGVWNPIVDSGLKRDGEIKLLDGCGKVIEHWKLDNCYPSNIKWGELDMDQSDVVTCDVTIRYDRAYLECSDPAQQIQPPPEEPSPGDQIQNVNIPGLP